MNQLSFLPMPMREVIARAIYEKRPFYMGTTINVMDGMGIATRFSWEGAPATYQDDCFEIADAVLAAIYLGQQPQGQPLIEDEPEGLAA